MSVIRYDDAGLCTRCGSTGYYVVARHRGYGQGPGMDHVTEPCPCHAWRPIETADSMDLVLLTGPDLAPMKGTPAIWLDLATHWQPLPQPPEVGT